MSPSGSAVTLTPMAHIEFIPERRADGSVVLRAITLGPLERVRRALRKLMRGA